MESKSGTRRAKALLSTMVPWARAFHWPAVKHLWGRGGFAHRWLEGVCGASTFPTVNFTQVCDLCSGGTPTLGFGPHS